MAQTKSASTSANVPTPEVEEPVRKSKAVTVFRDEVENDRYKKWKKLPLVTNMFFDKITTDQLGITTKLGEKAKIMGWPRMLEWAVPTFKDLTLEFLATLNFTGKDRYMNFRLCNRCFTIEVADLTKIFNFTQSHTQTMIDGKWLLMKSHVMWKDLTGSNQFRGDNSENDFNDDDIDIVYFHRVLACSLFGRTTTTERVNAKELKILYAYKKNMRAPWENEIWDHFKELATKEAGSLRCGALVTQLAIMLPLSLEMKIWKLGPALAETALNKGKIKKVTSKTLTRLKKIFGEQLKGKRRKKASTSITEEPLLPGDSNEIEEERLEGGEGEEGPSSRAGPRRRHDIHIMVDTLARDVYEMREEQKSFRKFIEVKVEALQEEQKSFRKSIEDKVEALQKSTKEMHEFLLKKFGCSTDTGASTAQPTPPPRSVQPERDQCPPLSNDFNSEVDAENDPVTEELTTERKRKGQKQKVRDDVLGNCDKHPDLVQEEVVRDGSLLPGKQCGPLKNQNTLDVEAVQPNRDLCPLSSNDSIKKADQVNADLSLPNKSDKDQDHPVHRIIPDMASRPKKLLILDVNGLLAEILPDDGKRALKAFTIISGKKVFKRPFCDIFLRFCFERFKVAVWSSRTKYNLGPIIEFLMGGYFHDLVFCWDQFHCTWAKKNTLENRHKPLFLKELTKVWQKLDFNESNTLLVDDSPYKALRNPAYTSIFPHSYKHTDAEDASLGPGGDLRLYLEGVANADSTQKYVEENPFGQETITDKHPDWNFYRNVVL